MLFFFFFRYSSMAYYRTRSLIHQPKNITSWARFMGSLHSHSTEQKTAGKDTLSPQITVFGEVHWMAVSCSPFGERCQPL